MQILAQIAISVPTFIFYGRVNRKVGRFGGAVSCGYDRKKGRLTGKKAEFPVDTTGKKAQ
jgi:hypothetical protein